MEISNYNSHKIKVLNLALIILVLVIHSYYLEAEGYSRALAIQKFTGNNGLSRMAVPLFFLISGMLFFNGITNITSCFYKQKKRIRTLLIPYLFWNMIFVLWYVVLQNLPGIGGFINSDMVGKVFGGSFINAIKELFWLPAAFQLWFLRDLLFIVLFTPALYCLIRYTKWFSPIILLFLMVQLVRSRFFDLIDYELYRIDGIVFFSIGGCISLFNSMEQVDKWLSKPIVAISFFIFIGNAVLQIFREDFNVWYNFATALCGCIVVWKVYDYLFNIPSISQKLSIIAPYLGYSFFIYLFHEPTFNIIKKLGLKILGVHEWSIIFLYISNPIIMCIFAILIAKIIQKHLPNVYAVLVGGR